MEVTKPPRELVEFLHRYHSAIQSLALGLRTVVLREVAPCHEYIFEMRSKVVLLYGATERVIKDGICGINVFTRHVTLAFPRGADLEDDRGMLKGTGKGMRHIRLRSLSELDRPELRGYLRDARRRAGPRRRQQAGDEIVTRVKAKSLTKGLMNRLGVAVAATACALGVLIAHAHARQPSRPAAVDVETIGPKVGEAIPDFTLPDQHGQARTMKSLLGSNGAVIVFFRSADW